MRPLPHLLLAAAAILMVTGCSGQALADSTPGTAGKTPQSYSAAVPAGEDGSALKTVPTDGPTSAAGAEGVDGTYAATGTAYDALSAYLQCRTLVLESLAGAAGFDPDKVTFAPFASSDLVTRADGLFYVYSEVSNANLTGSRVNASAAECVVGGTSTAPRVLIVGLTDRAPLSERNPELKPAS